jgi:hypothetical protein
MAAEDSRSLAPSPLPDVRASRSHARLAWRRRVAKLTRWLHIYGSMVSFAVVLFFAITGVTLNHQEWFAAEQLTTQVQGSMPTTWLATADVDKLQVAEFLRRTHGLRGSVSDFRVDDREANVAFKGPGYAVDVVIDRATGRYELTEVEMGFAAIINDLHKGRDTGGIWKGAIDVSAGVLVFISLSGLVLLYFVHRHRMAGALVLVIGAMASYGVYRIFVP